MQGWVRASLGAAVFIAGHYMLLRAASGRLNDTLGALVLEGAAATGIALNYFFGPRGPELEPTRLGIALAAMSGLCISGASILLFSALRRGGPVAATGTIVLGGGVTLSALAAPWVFAEGFTARRALGVLLGVGAMVVLSMDDVGGSPMILAGDVGGTRARLALYEGAKGKALLNDTFATHAHESLEALVLAFLKAGKKNPKRIKAATFGIAGPVIDQRCVATNFPWVVDSRIVSKKLGIPRVTLLNDLVALAFGALTVPRSKIRILHGTAPPKKSGGNLAVIAAGTGLGEAALVWDSAKHVPLATEGGHVDFAAQSPIEQELLVWLQKRFGHVSYERIVAGPGFSSLYDFFREEKRIGETPENDELLVQATDRNATIARLGMEEKSEPAARAVELFARIYGAEAGNLALKTLATAGVFVAGGIAGNMVETLAKGAFLEGFLDKGRFRPLLEKMPVAVVMDPWIGLAGSRYHAVRESEL